jgi:hypothetical protein
VARLRRAVLLGARFGGAGEGRRSTVRVGVERRGAAAAVRRALRLARVALPRMPPGPRRAVSPRSVLPSLLLAGWIRRPRSCSIGLVETDVCSSIASTWFIE